MSAAGYHVFTELASDEGELADIAAEHDADVLLIHHCLTVGERAAETARGLAADGAFGLFGTDGSFAERLHAVRVGAQIVLVPPYDNSGVTELDALLGLESAPPGRVLIVEDDAIAARARGGPAGRRVAD